MQLSPHHPALFPYTTLFRSWTDGGVLTGMATAYYRERALGGVGLIIIGATHIHPSSLAAPLITPQLFNDANIVPRSEEHTSELQSPYELVCRLLLEKKKTSK